MGAPMDRMSPSSARAAEGGDGQAPVGERKLVSLVELSGERGYLPLAAAFLAAYALRDPQVEEQVRVALVIEHTQIQVEHLLRRVLRDGVPDVLGVSCQGWSLPVVDAMARRLRALRPDMLIIYGGNHVSHQGERFFRTRLHVDVLVNGEGEATFHEVLLRYLAGGRHVDLVGVSGLSYLAGGSVVTNPDRERIADLDTIPSPYLTGLLDDHLAKCETALLETNRGCPYRCSFCYWGQAVGQRLHAFSAERLRQEMTYLATRGVDSWYICDANFGILPQDAEVVDEIVRLRERHGFPRTVHTNWAKNSNRRIVEICGRLNNGGVHSTYTLALQSTTPSALDLAHRANMKINKISEMAQLCRQQGVVPRGELIWGLPGETYAEFLSSYDDLARHTDALSVYPLYILPNTEYADKIDQYRIVTERAEVDTDYEYCVQHNHMTYEEFLTGLRFIVSNNILKVGGVIFRLFPRVAHSIGIPFHETIGRFGDWTVASDHPVAQRFRRYYMSPVSTHRQSLTEVWLALRRDRAGLLDAIKSYIETSICPRVPDRDDVNLLCEAFRFDAETYPLVDSREQEERDSLDGSYRRTIAFQYDFLSMKLGDSARPAPGHFVYSIEHPAGLWRYPVANWYFGLIGYQAKVARADPSVAPGERAA